MNTEHLRQHLITQQLSVCKRFDLDVLAKIANDAWNARPYDVTATEENEDDWTPLQKLECVLNDLLTVCLDDNRPAFLRRRSFVVLQQLIEEIRSQVSSSGFQAYRDPDHPVDNHEQHPVDHHLQQQFQEASPSINDIAVNPSSEECLPMDLDLPKEVCALPDVAAVDLCDSNRSEINSDSLTAAESAAVPHQFHTLTNVSEAFGPEIHSRDSLNKLGEPRGYVLSHSNVSCQSSEPISSTLEKKMTIYALADKKPTKANTVAVRPRTLVTFTGNVNNSSIDIVSIQSRLNEWDPFWSNIVTSSMGITCSVDATKPKTDLIKTAACFTVDTSSARSKDLSDGKQITSSEWKDGECAYLLRMLPLDYRNFAKHRSDCHIWPKGTFLQINGESIKIVQRKQLEHDPKKWSGMSAGFNIVSMIKHLRIPSNIAMFCYDDQAYVYCVTLSQYRSVDMVFQCLTNAQSPEKIKVVPLDESKRRAISFASSVVSINIEDDGGNNSKDEVVGKFVVSLKCPISKSVMEIPVRGRTCLHRQCFDLRNYISINANISGNRWRCACCELFVSLSSLEICGLTQHFLQTFHSAAGTNRDSVEFRSDGSYKFL